MASSSSPLSGVTEDLEKLIITAQAENSASSSKTVLLITSDSQETKVGVRSASLSKTINRILEDSSDVDGVVGPMPLDNINSTVLEKVLEYCNKHAAAESAPPAPLKEWDAEYVKGLAYGDLVAGDLDLLRQVLLAAHFLEIDGLLLLLVKAVADQIKTKSPSDIRRRFNIKFDFTPEQWEDTRKKHGWAAEEEWEKEEHDDETKV